MAELLAPWLTASIAIPLVAAGVAKLPNAGRHSRAIGVAASAASLLLSLETVRELIGAGGTPMSEPWLPALFAADSLNAVTMALFAFLALVTIVSAPRRDCGSGAVSAVMALMAGTLAVYGANYLALAGFLLLLAGVLLTGLVPFHGLVIRRFANGPPLAAGLLMNAHFGIFLIVRSGSAETASPWLGLFALFTALYTAILGTVERDPRRLLALIFIGQSASILAGLMTGTPEGTMGGLIQWIVLGVASTVLFSILRAIEVRIDRPLAGERLLGMAAQMPRLAVFFAVCALTLVGLPGTLGFPGEDLLIHGVLAAHPLIGIVLPVVIAINAFSLYKLFSRLFLGPAVTAWAGATDALPRERWAFSACLAILVWWGLMPSQVVALRSTAADSIRYTENLEVKHNEATHIRTIGVGFRRPCHSAEDKIQSACAVSDALVE